VKRAERAAGRSNDRTVSEELRAASEEHLTERDESILTSASTVTRDLRKQPSAQRFLAFC
jgi:hypothetical protein